MDFVRKRLENLRESNNFRLIPDVSSELIDFSSNDYLGLAENDELRKEFFTAVDVERLVFSSSASRLLSKHQSPFNSFETLLQTLYGRGRKALVFNSGYHANVGILSSLGKNVVVLADKLVHASIIDGIKLGGGQFARFAHNDIASLERLLKKYSRCGLPMLIVVESVYSMDGDYAPIEEFVELKKLYPETYLYVDEAHAVGVEGQNGLGLAKDFDTDIIVGTLGKALAGQGAFAICSPLMRDYLVNCARSFIFSTAIPPVNIAWNEFVFRKSLEMDAERSHLKNLGAQLSRVLKSSHSSHIQPLIIGDAARALELSKLLKQVGISALAIRTPTVPAGTERLRFSLSASLTAKDVDELENALQRFTL